MLVDRISREFTTELKMKFQIDSTLYAITSLGKGQLLA